MKKVLVTGSNGFIGKNLITRLKSIENIKVYEFDVNHTFNDLVDAIDEVDFIFHLAGVNRPKDIEEFIEGNKNFTEQILDLIQAKGRKIPFLITSSIQAELDNPYGVSKKFAEDAVFKYAEELDVNVYIYRLPNVFGKWCRPNYNSVIATWCYNIANDIEITVSNKNNVLSLVYIDHVIDELINALSGNAHPSNDGYCYIQVVFNQSLGQIHDLLYAFKASRQNLILPNFGDLFTKCLYSTYLSYLPQNSFGYHLEMKTDHRGWLAEFIKTEQSGQIFISKTKPGVTRGNHWHHTKVEKFLVIEGDAIIRFRNILSEEVLEYSVSGNDLKVLDIPVGYTHNIANVGSTDVITLFWANEQFNPDYPDTYYLEV